jgi:CRP-like cAMP-binding protein
LARGKIEIFLTIPEGELILDTITEPGSVFAQISILNRMKMTYSARAGEDSEILTISNEKLIEQRALNHMQPLNTQIDKFFDKVINPLDLQDKRNLMGFLDYNKKRPKGLKRMSQAQRAEVWKQIIYR